MMMYFAYVNPSNPSNPSNPFLSKKLPPSLPTKKCPIFNDPLFEDDRHRFRTRRDFFHKIDETRNTNNNVYRVTLPNGRERFMTVCHISTKPLNTQDLVYVGTTTIESFVGNLSDGWTFRSDECNQDDTRYPKRHCHGESVQSDTHETERKQSVQNDTRYPKRHRNGE